MGFLQDKLGESIKDYLFPPPIFIEMKGEFINIDLESKSLSVKFPIFESYRNPYGTMQGGMIATAVDNTLGPLSVVIAPLNVTRKLEMKYSQPVIPEMGYIVVEARLVGREDPKLYFEALVSSPDGQRLAKCKALHWIIEDQAA
jgi:acyl-coenzyme A thioesterase PaaI-like protein